MLHFFQPEIADKYGVNAAILLQNIYYWCDHNRTNDKHFNDGLYWTYNSRKAFQEQFSYMGEKQIRNALNKLKDAGLIVFGNYNKSSYDKTLWYAITEKGLLAIGATVDSTRQKGPIDESKRAYRVKQKGQPIPDINPDIYTHHSPDIEENEDEFNPYGEGKQPDADNVYAYASKELLSISPRAMAEIRDFADELSEEVVRHAIDNALDQGVRTWTYVKSILNSYAEARVRSLQDAKKVDEQHKTKKQDGTKPAKVTTNDNEGPFGKWVL